MKNLLAIVFFSFSFLIFTTRVEGQEKKFETSYNVTYEVLENGDTIVTQQVILKNKTADFRASSYTLIIGLSDIQNLSATDTEGSILERVEREEGRTNIKLAFNQVVVGKDRMLPFTISFRTKELTKRKGEISEIYIPGIEEKGEIDEYKVILTVAQSFGNPTFIKPRKEGQLSWTKDEIPRGGIQVVFGQSQIYNFHLSYHLKNPRFFPIETEIALPPNTSYQKVFLREIVPHPLNVTLDSDGNWLAKYRLSSGQTLSIEVKGNAQVFLSPVTKSKVSDAELENYRKASKYWDVSDGTIQELANFLKNPKTMYNFVVNELTYDIGRVEEGKGRVGAANLLNNKNSAICMEFTDLFIALARAKGIAAREINGFAYAQDPSVRPLSLRKDILHAWPEYFDEEKGTWIMVDPTWGNTTGGVDYFDVFDFDHLTFVIKGKSSQYPIPAGGYKVEGRKETKDVNVSFGTAEDIREREDTALEFVVAKKHFPGLPIKGELVLRNRGNTLLPSQTIKLEVVGLTPASQIINVSEIPPFGDKSTPFTLKTSFLQNEKTTITARSDTVSKDIEILISPFIIVNAKTLLLLGGGIGGTVCLIAIARKARHLYLQGREE